MRAALVTVLAAAALTTSCTDHDPATPAPEVRPSASSSPASPATGRTQPVACTPGEQTFVRGVRHTIAGEVFGRPLTSPPSRDHNNKILWRVREVGIGDLVITASLNGSGLQVRRRVPGGPGPSIINLPRPGCWTFELTWAEGHDVVAVRYDRPA